MFEDILTIFLPECWDGSFRLRITSTLFSVCSGRGKGDEQASETGIFPSRYVLSLGEGPRPSESAVCWLGPVWGGGGSQGGGRTGVRDV